MPPPLSGWLVRCSGLGPIERYLKEREGHRPHSSHPSHKRYRQKTPARRAPAYAREEYNADHWMPHHHDNRWKRVRPSGHRPIDHQGYPRMHHVDDVARRHRLRPPHPGYAHHRPMPGIQPFFDERLLPRRSHAFHDDPRYNPRYPDDFEDFDEDNSEEWEQDPYPSDAEEYYDDSEFGDQSFERHDPRRLRFREPSFLHHRDPYAQREMYGHRDPCAERELYGRRQRMYQDPHDAYHGVYDHVPRPYPRDDYRTGRYYDDEISTATLCTDDESY